MGPEDEWEDLMSDDDEMPTANAIDRNVNQMNGDCANRSANIGNANGPNTQQIGALQSTSNLATGDISLALVINGKVQPLIFGNNAPIGGQQVSCNLFFLLLNDYCKH